MDDPQNQRVYLDISTGGVAQGRVVIELFSQRTPLTAANFASLCCGEAGLSYEGSRFHRIIPGFMVQGGDITAGDGTGGASIYGSTFADECFSPHNVAGLLSMANRGPDTNSSQFFISAAPAPHLDGKHVVFGRVAQGMSIVKRMAKVSTDEADQPAEAVLIVGCGLLLPEDQDGFVDHIADSTEGADLSTVRGTGKMLFRPQLFWQQVLPNHVAEAKLEFRMGIDTGVNLARLSTGQEVAEDSSYAQSCATCVGAGDSPGDEVEVAKALREVATWGKEEKMRHLLCSCYCTPQSTAGALVEASARGHTAVVELLLKAGSSPGLEEHGKNAFHRACEEGQEEVGKVLIQHMSSMEDAMRPCASGQAAFELARQQELGGCARRLEAYLKETMEARC